MRIIYITYLCQYVVRVIYIVMISTEGVMRYIICIGLLSMYYDNNKDIHVLYQFPKLIILHTQAWHQT